MPFAVRVKNVNPIGAVTTVIDGEPVEVAAGEVISVTPEAAGQAPRWRRVAEGEQVEGHQETREHAGHLEVHDLGSGLLAQTTNWELVSDDTAKENN